MRTNAQHPPSRTRHAAPLGIQNSITIDGVTLHDPDGDGC